ncbi:Abi family protein [Desulfitibacter alkalitolerans]|uniref:Abi family protein n=1 Tax=Desulfitibacter alkalitolerans TaxID=264641 RepID=UPI00146F96FC|nr:Abi family protein [Desulfitibacter alkalitolerans]
MIIKNEDFAKRILSHVNYYRLSGYSLHLRHNDVFHEGVTFEGIYQIYQFDKKLRYLLLDLIETVEISFRTHIAYYLAHKYGPFSYLESSFFENEKHHLQFLEEFEKQVTRNHNKELFVRHHTNLYEGKFPVWVATELFSFGMLSRFFSNLKKHDKDAISKVHYTFPSVYITTWLRSLGTLRNTCAHYCRLYNKYYNDTPKLPSEAKENDIQYNGLYANIYILKFLIDDRDKWTSFIINLEALMQEYNAVDISLLGFPEDKDWVKLLKKA